MTEPTVMELLDDALAQDDSELTHRALMQRARAEIVALRAELDQAIGRMSDIRAEALEEAAKRIEPKNPEHDWTDYARIHADCAAAIRALKDKRDE